MTAIKFPASYIIYTHLTLQWAIDWDVEERQAFEGIT